MIFNHPMLSCEKKFLECSDDEKKDTTHHASLHHGLKCGDMSRASCGVIIQGQFPKCITVRRINLYRIQGQYEV